MKNTSFAFLVTLLLGACAAYATTAHFGGVKPATGTLYWWPVLADGTPASYELGGCAG